MISHSAEMIYAKLQYLLQYFTVFFKDRVTDGRVSVSVADNSDVNQMTSSNLALIFGPTLMKYNK